MRDGVLFVFVVVNNIATVVVLQRPFAAAVQESHHGHERPRH